ncbi:MAG: ComEC/Rec2 family competence protein [Paracoccaceae bacterium]
MAQKDRSDKVTLTLPHIWSLKPDFSQLYAMQSPRFVLWLPVAMGIGIWVYFALWQEPAIAWAALPLVPMALLALGVARRIGWAALAFCWLALMATAGFSLALWSAHRADAPVVKFPLGETVEGRVLQLSRSASGKPRLLLDDVVVYGVEPEAQPVRVRLTLLDPPAELPMPGTRLRVYATLMPTGQPVEPGGFDFNRRAFFARLGAVGLSRGVLVPLPERKVTGLWDHGRIWVATVQAKLSASLRAALPGPEGAFAAAIIVGDRMDIEDVDAEALRASNLAHLLAISGLHMGILTGLVFALARFLLAIPPQIALRWQTKKLAAVAALMAGLAYLMLSGATVATQRAFIMVAVALCAVLMDRPAITLRALAVAAMIILAIRPISLLDAGFQMSFAATAALVAGFGAIRRPHGARPVHRAWPFRLGRMLAVYVGALLFSSLLAGLATAPIAAYHFNRTAPYGLLANLLAVPAMGMWIAPWACVSAVLAPFGGAEPALKAMGQGISFVLWVAHWVGGLPGAVRPVQAASPIVLALIVTGGLWFMLWAGRWRMAGFAIVGVGVLLWMTPDPRPQLLIAPEARLVGVMSAQGRALDHKTAQGFAAKTWLRRDGDMAEQETAAARAKFDRAKGQLSGQLSHGWKFATIWGNNPDIDALRAECQPNTVLIARHGPKLDGPCRYFGKRELRRLGALAVTPTEDGLTVRAARPPGRKRLWISR